MSKADLRLDWCSHAAAKYAVEHWHYSRVMPAGKAVHVGAWEGSQFIGAVLFSMGANNNIGKPYGLACTEVCELVRVALRQHTSAVSRIVAIAIKMLRRQSPGLRLIVSYADEINHGHLGGIYQAGNWLYAGKSDNWKGSHYIVGGKLMHGRSVRAKWGSEKNIPCEWQYAPPQNKHKYLMPLDAAMRAQIAPLAKPYPKRATRGAGETDSAPRPNAEIGGASPTAPLLVDICQT